MAALWDKNGTRRQGKCTVISCVMLCSYEARVLFILSWQGGIRKKVGQKSRYKCFAVGWFWNSAITWLKVANKCAQKTKKQNFWKNKTSNAEPSVSVLEATQFFYVRNSKDFKIALKKKMNGKKYSLHS